MAGVTGLEPAASGVTGRRSNQLSYTPLRALRRPEAIPARMYGVGFTESRRAQICALTSERRRGQSEKRSRMVGGDRLELPTSTV